MSQHGTKEDSSDEVSASYARTGWPRTTSTLPRQGGQGGGAAARDLPIDLPSLAQPVRQNEADAKELNGLRRENQRLKKIVPVLALDIDMLKEVKRGNFSPRTAAGGQSNSCNAAGANTDG
jgi:hypothetical protein